MDEEDYKIIKNRNITLVIDPNDTTRINYKTIKELCDKLNLQTKSLILWLIMY